MYWLPWRGALLPSAFVSGPSGNLLDSPTSHFSPSPTSHLTAAAIPPLEFPCEALACYLDFIARPLTRTSFPSRSRLPAVVPHLSMRTPDKSSTPEPDVVRAAKRTWTENGAESLLSSKRQKKPAQLPETADDTTQQDDVIFMGITYMGGHQKTRQNVKSKANSFPIKLSHIIDLTLDDELDDVSSTRSKTSKAHQDSADAKNFLRRAPFGILPRRPPPLPEGSLGEATRERERKRMRENGAREEHNDSKYASRKNAAGHASRPSEVLGSDDSLLRDDGSEGEAKEQTWVLSKEGEERVRRAEKRGLRRERKTPQFERKQRKMQNAKSAVPYPTPTFTPMFTIPEAIVALANPDRSNSIRYDLPTGKYLAYPVKQSYHLGAMGRYGVDATDKRRRDPSHQAAYKRCSFLLEYQ
jgi:hypothetical protein